MIGKFTWPSLQLQLLVKLVIAIVERENMLDENKEDSQRCFHCHHLRATAQQQPSQFVIRSLSCGVTCV